MRNLMGSDGSGWSSKSSANSLHVLKMKIQNKVILVFFVFLMVPSYGCAIQPPIEELPMYGNIQKTEEQKDVDRELIETVEKEWGSKEEAAKRAIILAEMYLRKSKPDFKTAMKRCNQAWLLTPNDPLVYGCFARVLSVQNKLDEAIEMIEKATSMDSENPRLLLVAATSYLNKGDSLKDHQERVRYFDKTIDSLQKAVDLDPRLKQYAYEVWAYALFNLEQYDKAWDKLRLAQDAGNKNIDPAFMKMVQQKISKGE